MSQPRVTTLLLIGTMTLGAPVLSEPPNIFSDGEAVRASELNENFNYLREKLSEVDQIAPVIQLLEQAQVEDSPLQHARFLLSDEKGIRKIVSDFPILGARALALEEVSRTDGGYIYFTPSPKKELEATLLVWPYFPHQVSRCGSDDWVCRGNQASSGWTQYGQPMLLVTDFEGNTTTMRVGSDNLLDVPVRAGWFKLDQVQILEPVIPRETLDRPNYDSPCTGDYSEELATVLVQHTYYPKKLAMNVGGPLVFKTQVTVMSEERAESFPFNVANRVLTHWAEDKSAPIVLAACCDQYQNFSSEIDGQTLSFSITSSISPVSELSFTLDFTQRCTWGEALFERNYLMTAQFDRDCADEASCSSVVVK